jgi:hypothetical protein
MTAGPVYDPTSVLCVGRQPQRDAFATLVRDGEASPQTLQLAFLRGIGGIGKTTLSRQLSNDLVALQPDRTVILLDCTSLPPRPTMTSIVRALAASAGDDEAAEPLVALASTLDTVAVAVRDAQPPSDSSEEDQESWKLLRSFALEALTSISSVAVETTVLGQPITGMQNAVLAGVRAMAAAARSSRDSLLQVVRRLKADGVIDDEQFGVAADPERAVLDALVEFVHRASGDEGIALFWDKAENISTSIYRLNEYFTRMAIEVPLLVVYAGRIEHVLATDGSELAMSQYREALAARSVDLDLRPFTEADTAQLLGQMYLRRHGVEVPPPPDWIVEAVHQLAEGLPLWTALLVEALTAETFEDWEQIAFTRRLRTLAGARADVRTIVAQLLSELPLAGQADTLPLIAALAIAPPGAPNEIISQAAGLSDSEQLSLLAGKYSFMRDDRLHDTVQSVIRHYLAAVPEGREVATRVAEVLLEWQEQRKPTSVPLSDGDDRWRAYLRETVRLRCWSDVEEGVRFGAETCVAGLAVRAAWIALVLREVAWFITRISVRRKTHEFVNAISRAAYPILIVDVMITDLSDEQITQVRKHSIDRGYKFPAFWTSLGRNLDKIRSFAADGFITDNEALLALTVAHADWLCRNGFNDESLYLLKGCSGKLSRLPHGARLREVAAAALANAVQGSIVVLSNDDQTDLQPRRALVDRALEIVRLSPDIAAQFAVNNVRLLQRDGSLDDFVRRLSNARHRMKGDVVFAAALSHLLQTSGRFEEAATVCMSTLSIHNDWLTGWNDAIHTLFVSGKYNAAADAARRGAAVAATISTTQLTEYGLSRRKMVFGTAILVLSCTGQTASAAELIESLPASIPKSVLSYSLFVHNLFGGDVDAAQKYLEIVVAPPSNPENYATELGLLCIRAGAEEDGHRYLVLANENTRSTWNRALELAVAECAYNAGWLNIRYLDALRGRAGALTGDVEEGASDDQVEP